MSSRDTEIKNGMSGVPAAEGAAKSRPKGSYPSRQQRFGAAPLASFEDLPSDDQQSPDDDDPDSLSDRCLPPGVKNVLDLDSSQLLLHKSTSGESAGPALSPTLTVTPTGDCGERKSSNCSQNTLTLGGSDSATPVPAVSNSASLSSLKNEGKRQEGSHNSLLLTVPDMNGSKSPSGDPKRKSSWTDIFFPTRTRSKSTSSSPRKSPNTERKRSVFTKFFGGGRKASSKGSESPEKQSREASAVESLDTPRVSVTDTSENEPHEELMIGSPINEPKPSEQDIIGILEAANSQMESMITTPVDDDSSRCSIPVPLPPLNLRKKLRRRESTIDDDVQSLPEILPSSRSSRLLTEESTATANDRNEETVVVQIESSAKYEDNSSESEIGFDENNRLKVKAKGSATDGKTSSDDDFEAQNLLTQDSIDYDENSFTDSFAANMALMTNSTQSETIRSPTYKERLEVLTIPIERPRSTTPINIVPLEAYIRSSSISPDPNVEKIKLSLPGEQFSASARAKSPRKSNPSIWFEFCEKGLQSPQQRRKQRANSCFPSVDVQPHPFINANAFDPFAVAATNQALMTPSPGNLTPVTPLEGFGFSDSKWPGFGDNFVNFDSIMSTNGGPIDSFGDKFSCKCECNTNISTNSAVGEQLVSASTDTSLADESLNKNNNNSVNAADHEYMEDQPLVSPCHCLCHRRADFALTLWKSSSFNKQESISSDISSASSRLIGSSSSNSKCSPSDDILESLNS
ncbi:unnamed protein product [Medioppia subpectinata]|uniref:Uncharacterized protein n=1 Tax=Medioppia subpectinata TaxID=1979941 RepID=A0A7R9KR63_9ACAR|nr:unnamed protein product [Medioppia subpectinata]CAG2106930.1 unnamed protein product [Medioppia subpectinata]